MRGKRGVRRRDVARECLELPRLEARRLGAAALGDGVVRRADAGAVAAAARVRVLRVCVVSEGGGRGR